MIRSQIQIFHFEKAALILQLLFSYQVYFSAGVDVREHHLQKVLSCNSDVGVVENSILETIGCWPCDKTYLTSSYFSKHSTLLDFDFHEFIGQEVASDGNCSGNRGKAISRGITVIHRHLRGEGSHRHLISSTHVSLDADVVHQLDDMSCEVVFIERLPDGVFADPFELQHLVDRGVFLNAAVFGDINLELPSALSNRSIVEVHTNIRYFKPPKCWDIVVELPLHARYPPLNVTSYALVEFASPDVFIRCKPMTTTQQQHCSFTLYRLSTRSDNKITWKIPCGNEVHSVFVSSITFASALVCAVLVAICSFCFSYENDMKTS